MGRPDMVKTLLKYGADWRTTCICFFQLNAAHACLFRKKYETLFILIKYARDLSISELIKSSQEIENQWKDMNVILLDDYSRSIFEFFENDQKRIDNYFEINRQIDYVDSKKDNIVSKQYATILGKVPKYAIKDICDKHIKIK